MLRPALFSVLIGIAASINPAHHLKSSLLRKARSLEDGADDMSWLIDYSIKFDSCHSIKEYKVDEDGAGGIYLQKLVKFNICPKDECSWNCKGGRYIVQMEDFVETYAEYKQTEKEYNCQAALENCGCENDDDAGNCEKNCYSAASLDCYENNGDDQDDDYKTIDILDYIECQELNNNNENGNDDDNQQRYIGLKCSDDGQGINLGIFSDEYCSVPADYYLSFPYQSESIVAKDCVSCTNIDGNQDDGADYELSDVCAANYVESVKCEKQLDIYYQNNDGCDLIDSVHLKGEEYYNTNRYKTALIAAFILFFASVILAVIAIRLCCVAERKIELYDEPRVGRKKWKGLLSRKR